MNIDKCSECSNHYESDDLTKIDGTLYCTSCYNLCQNCNKPFNYTDIKENYCYWCLEGGLITNGYS